MARTAKEQLDALDALIAKLESDGVAEWSEGSRRFRVQDLPALYAERRKLQQGVVAEGGVFSLLEPFNS